MREIGEAVGLASSATVHNHLAVLQREGYLSRDPSKPRAIQVHFDPDTTSRLDVSAVHNVPLVGDVAAGTGVMAEENVEELLPMPAQFTGNGPSFMLRVRGDSMIEAGIFDGDYVVVRQQQDADNGDVVVAGIADGEATVKTFSRRDGQVVLMPANAAYEPMVFDGAGRGHDLRQGRDRRAPAQLGRRRRQITSTGATGGGRPTPCRRSGRSGSRPSRRTRRTPAGACRRRASGTARRRGRAP